jgi:hypothetical protein
MDAAEVLSGLHDVRTPTLGAAEILSDALAGAAIGLALALVLFLLVRGLTTERATSPRERARAELARARSLEPSQRLLALATLLARVAPDPAPGLHPASTPGRPQASDPSEADWQRLRAYVRGALYRPNSTIDLDRVETDILRLLADVRG